MHSETKHWYGSMAGAKQETENAEVPALYAKKDYATILKYVEGEMKNMQMVYEGISKETFYKEHVKKRKDIMGISPS